MNDKKIPFGSLISTILIGIYTIFFLCAGIASLFLFRYATEITTAGINLATNFGGNGDYIGGYLIFPSSLTVLFGGMTGIIGFLLAVGIVLLFVVFLILLISSIVMLKKQKIKADACVKITIFSIFSILSLVLFQSAWIILPLIIPVILGITVLLSIHSPYS